MYKEVKLHNSELQYAVITDSEVPGKIELSFGEKGHPQAPLYLSKQEAVELASELMTYANSIKHE